VIGGSVVSWLTVGGSVPDISSKVRGITIRRGRADELDRINAATISLRVDNRDGRFDPTYDSGPYGTALDLGAFIHVFVANASTSRNLFSGFLWEFPPEWPVKINDEVVTLGGADHMNNLARAGYYRNGGRASEVAGSRIEDVLEQTRGTATIFTDIDTGIAILEPIEATAAGGTVTNPVNALTHIQDVATTEGGLFYVKPDGTLRFEEREQRQNIPFKRIAAVFGDAGTAAPYYATTTVNSEVYGIGTTVELNGNPGTAGVPASGTAIYAGHEITYTLAGTVLTIAGTLSPYLATTGGGTILSLESMVFGEIPYQGLDPTYDDTFLTNEWIVTSGAGSASAIDTGSVDRYFRRTQSRETLGVSALELNSTANYLLGRTKSPALRFPTITVMPQQTAAINALMTVMGLGISDRVILKRRPPGGRFWRQDCLVEGVGYDITTSTIQAQLNLSPADMTTYWILGTHALDSTAIVGY